MLPFLLKVMLPVAFLTFLTSEQELICLILSVLNKPGYEKSFTFYMYFVAIIYLSACYGTKGYFASAYWNEFAVFLSNRRQNYGSYG
jgi:hypothetical protein